MRFAIREKPVSNPHPILHAHIPGKGERENGPAVNSFARPAFP